MRITTFPQKLFIGALLYAFVPTFAVLGFYGISILTHTANEGYGALAIVVGSLALMPGLFVAVCSGIYLFFKKPKIEPGAMPVKKWSAQSLWIIAIGLLVVVASAIVFAVLAKTPRQSTEAIDRAAEKSQKADAIERPPLSVGKVEVVSPNGGEVLKIGKTVRVMWNANPAEASLLDVELFELKGDTPIIDSSSVCTNCSTEGLRSGLSALSPISNGVAGVEWVVGEQYAGGYVKPGSHYVMKMTLKREGTKSECPTQFPACSIQTGVDWSDGAFTLEN